MPQPSLRTKPSADASKVLHRPSGESMRAWDAMMLMSGARMALTPPASASSHSPARRLWQARCTATSDEEQAVSTAMLGPCRPRTCDSRPARGVQRGAGQGVSAEAVIPAVRTPQPQVVASADADEHAGPVPGQRIRGDPGILERLPGDLQQDAMLGIHVSGLARGDPEEGGIELIDAAQEAAAARTDRARRMPAPDRSRRRCRIGRAEPPRSRPRRFARTPRRSPDHRHHREVGSRFPQPRPARSWPDWPPPIGSASPSSRQKRAATGQDGSIQWDDRSSHEPSRSSSTARSSSSRAEAKSRGWSLSTAIWAAARASRTEPPPFGAGVSAEGESLSAR